MSRYEDDPDYDPRNGREGRRGRRTQAVAPAFGGGVDDTAYSEFITALDERTQNVDQLRADLIQSDSVVRNLFNNIHDTEESKEALVYFFNRIPLAERTISDRSVLTRLGCAGTGRVAASFKTKLRYRFLIVASIESALNTTKEWSVETFNQMLEDTHPHYGEHKNILFSVFVNAMKKSRGVSSRNGLKGTVPEFSIISDEALTGIQTRYNQLDSSQFVVGGRRRLGLSGGLQESDLTHLGGTNNADWATSVDNSAMGGLGPYPSGNTGPVGISGVEDLRLLAQYQDEAHVYSFSHPDGQATPAKVVFDSVDWKSGQDYWSGFIDDVQRFGPTRLAHSVRVTTKEDVSFPIIVVKYTPENADSFEIEVDCMMVVRMIAPFLNLSTFMQAFEFTEDDQQTAARMFHAIFMKDTLWIEIQAWFKRGRPYLSEQSSSMGEASMTAIASSWLDSFVNDPRCGDSRAVVCAPTVISSSNAASDAADAGSISVRLGDGEVCSGMQNEAEVVSDSQGSFAKRRRVDAAGDDSFEIMDALSNFQKSFQILEKSLANTLSDDSRLKKMEEALVNEKKKVNDELGKLQEEKKLHDEKVAQTREDMKLITAEVRENQRILCDLRVWQAATRENLLKNQGTLALFGMFCTETREIVIDYKQNLEESLGMCQSTEAAVKQFGDDMTAAEQRLREKLAEERDLDSRLASLRELVAAQTAEEAAVKARVAAQTTEESAVTARVTALKTEEENIIARVTALKTEEKTNQSTINDQRVELGNLRDKIKTSGVAFENIQKYKREYPKMIQRQRELEARDAELTQREQALQALTRGSAPESSLDSTALGRLASGCIHSIGGAADGVEEGSPDHRLEVGSGTALRPGSIGH